MARKIKEKMNLLSDTAKSNLSPMTVDLISNKEALINGCKGIIEYDESAVRINCGHLIVSFEGSDLSIKALSVEEIIVSGEIMKIEFSNC